MANASPRHHCGQPWRRYADLEQLERGANAAAAPCRQSVKPGDFVALGCPTAMHFRNQLSVWKCGATPTSLSWRLPRGEAAAVLEILKPALVVGGEADWNAPNSLSAISCGRFFGPAVEQPGARYWKR